ncbi:MAG: ABC transporter permease [Gemmatimonadales bacterium]
MSSVVQDLKLALRGFQDRPGFAVAAVVTLALGIGATTAIFSVVNTVLLRRLPYEDPDRLVMIWSTNPAKGDSEGRVSFPDFRDWRERSESFEDLAAFMAFANGNVNLTGGSAPERVPVARVTAGYFELLGVSPVQGRAVRPEENVVGHHRVAMLSFGLWQRQFGADPGLVGRSVYVNGFPYTVIGIMPQGFRPMGDVALGLDVDLWRPLAPDDNQTGGRSARQLQVVGRLKDAVSLDEAQHELEQIARALALEYPETNGGRGVRVVSLHDQVVREVRPALVLLMTAVGLVLLIAGTNMANLLMVRAMGRTREIAVRAALGSPRRRIVRQLLTESALLGLMGGIGGILLAFGGIGFLVSVAPQSIPMLDAVRIDGVVLTFAVLVSVGSGLVFGLVPALRLTNPNLATDLRDGTRRSASASHRRVADVLVVSQIAVALMLAVAAGLIVRSFQAVMQVEPGYDPTNVITAQLELPMATTYPTQDSRDEFFTELLDRVRTLPGVEGASIASSAPMGENRFRVGFTVAGMETGDQELSADLRVVGPTYFDVMRIPRRAGRTIATTDVANGPPVAVINETLARQLWPDESSLSARITLDFGMEAEIVGVVGDVRTEALDADILPMIYWPSVQMPYNFMTLFVRTNAAPSSVIPLLRAEIEDMDGDLPVYNLRSLENLINRSVADRRFQMILLGSFSALAVLLSLVGIYGVVAYTVNQRTNEIGVRMALGARGVDALRLVVRHGAWLATTGISIGVVASLFFNRLLAGFLFGVGSVDPLTYSASIALLGAAAIAATYVPASRAAGIDPMEALRAE